MKTFSLVDSITRSGMNPAGRLHLPADLVPFPPGLVAEAIGQLAAWAAMEAVDFRRRPVAGIAAEVSLPRNVPSNVTLDLEAEIEHVRDESVAYGGRATVDGDPVVELRGCLGAMLPTEDLDDPASTRDRFTRLTVDGARESGISLDVLAAIRSRPVGGESGRRRITELHVSAEAGFFAEHFPRRPVFPGTLLFESKIRVGLTLAAQALGVPQDEARIRVVRGVKLRRFLSPGTVVTLVAEIDRLTADGARVRLRAEVDGRPVATSSATAEIVR